MDSWPNPQSGPSPENEVIIPNDGTPAKPITPPPPEQPKPEPAKPEAPAEKKTEAKAEPAIDQDRLNKQIKFFLENPEAGKQAMEALLSQSERNPLAELDNLKRDLAIEKAARHYGIPEQFNALIEGDTPEAINAKAAAVAQLLKQQQAQPAGTPETSQAEIVNQPQAPAPIPPPARPNLDPRTADIKDLEAAAMAEPIMSQWGEQVKEVKSDF